jgi:hypothetical protein
MYTDKKRKPLSNLRSVDDADIAYQSTSNYLRQMKLEPNSIESSEIMLTRNIPRTRSAKQMSNTKMRKSFSNIISKW